MIWDPINNYESNYLAHYGVGHDKGGHSGRYPWGSGKNPDRKYEKLKSDVTKSFNSAFEKSDNQKDFYGRIRTGLSGPKLSKLQGTIPGAKDMQQALYEHKKTAEAYKADLIKYSDKWTKKYVSPKFDWNSPGAAEAIRNLVIHDFVRTETGGKYLNTIKNQRETIHSYKKTVEKGAHDLAKEMLGKEYSVEATKIKDAIQIKFGDTKIEGNNATHNIKVTHQTKGDLLANAILAGNKSSQTLLVD